MKGLLSSRLLKGVIHTTGMKSFSLSVNQRPKTGARVNKAHARNTLIDEQHLEFSERKSLTKLESMGSERSADRALENTNESRGSSEVNESASEVSEGVQTCNEMIENEETDQGSDDRINGLSEKRLTGGTVESLKFEEMRKKPIIPPAWQSAVDSILESSFSDADIERACADKQCSLIPIVVVCGGKGAGKSTFARHLVNSFLKGHSKVGYLDTDLGQPELTPPGCLSLHILDKHISGPTSLEMRSPERSYFFGDISPENNPELYVLSVMSLFDHFCEEYCDTKMSTQVKESKGSEIPLVINTHGWIKGTGYDVLVKILCHTLPTHVVQVLFLAQSKNLPQGRFWDLEMSDMCNTKLIYIHSAVQANHLNGPPKFDAPELRDLRVMSYFRACFEDNLFSECLDSDIYAEMAKALIFHVPYQVPITAIHIVHLHGQVPASESHLSLNATLVGLGMRSTSKLCSGGIVKSLPPVCIGLGIVRGVDIQNDCFYVITPVPLEKLQMVDAFVQGHVEIPISLLQVPGYPSPYLCQNWLYMERTGSASMGCGKRKNLRARPVHKGVGMVV